MQRIAPNYLVVSTGANVTNLGSDHLYGTDNSNLWDGIGSAALYTLDVPEISIPLGVGGGLLDAYLAANDFSTSSTYTPSGSGNTWVDMSTGFNSIYHNYWMTGGFYSGDSSQETSERDDSIE
ncbi:MAG: hypothetical protein M1410_06190 [Candidatus Thermoplasmatota archaeon]|nr:hypothetical protein [Candidatus Thermoplasmatota archaeon]